MSYTPHTWQTGETVTAEKLNALEQGVGSGGGVFTISATFDTTSNNLILSATAAEIIAAATSGKLCYIYYFNAVNKEAYCGVVKSLSYGGDDPGEGDCWILIITTTNELTFEQPSGVTLTDMNFYPVSAS